MKQLCGIYKITNLLNSKIYVGQSTHIFKRWHEHLTHLSRGDHINNHLQSAFNQYGADAFRFEIVEECDKDQLNQREQYWIQYYHSFGENGYNLTAGGDGNRGWHPSESVIQKHYHPVVCLNTGVKYDSVKAAKFATGISGSGIVSCCTGYKHYAGSVDGERMVWRYLTDYQTLTQAEIRTIISEAQNFKRAQPTKKIIVCLNTGEQFCGLSAASKFAQTKNNSSINSAVLGKCKSAGKHPETGENLVWLYLDDYIKLTPEEVLEKIRLANEFNIADIRSIPVVCLNDRREFKSATEAGHYYSVSQPMISATCSSESGSVGYFEKYNQRLVFVYKTVFDSMSEAEISDRLQNENLFVEYVGNSPKNSKPVLCINTGEVFPSSVYASQKYNVTPTCIRMACNGKAGCAGRHPETGEKLKWKFIKDALPNETMSVAS